MKHKRTIFYTWILPLLWTPCPLIQYRFPGDEYAMFAVSSIPGFWVGLIRPFGDIHDPAIPISIALAGALTVTAIGLLMDWMRVSKKTWVALFLSPLVIFSVITIVSRIRNKGFESPDDLMTSIPLFISLSLYLSVPISVVSKGIGTFIRKIRIQQGNREVREKAGETK